MYALHCVGRKIQQCATCHECRHRLLVFRNQGTVSGTRQVEISRWFGELESTFYKHPASPHPDVFRVSNDPKEGCTGVGRTGWHVDGSFQDAPFSHSLYHIISVPNQGDTIFAPLSEVIESLPQEQRNKWERLHMLSDRRNQSVKPLIYSHPLSGKPTMCLHTGMTEAFVWDYNTPEQKIATPQETLALLREIENTFRQYACLWYTHKWKQGDFIISDNAALGHEAAPETQLSKEEVGLRVMHRTTVKGITPPQKQAM